MLEKEIVNRKIPDVLKFFSGKEVASVEDWKKRREELLDYFQSEMYGYIPSSPDEICFEEINTDETFCGGKAKLTEILIKVKKNGKTASFPVYFTLPVKKVKGAFVFANFRPNIPDKCLPVEEIVDNGYAVFSFFYEDASSDNDDFTNGFASLFFENGKRKGESDAGKISIWAWAMMRVMDYVETIPCIPQDRVILIGHSRLGKTALLAGAYDERFYAVISNESGCGGAALIRGEQGETFPYLYSVRPYWFAPKCKAYAMGEREMLVDQHCLLSLIAPRKLYVASALLDVNADPYSELLSCVAASPVYELFDKKGFVHTDKFLTEPTCLHSGNIAYHLREGVHYLNRDDWNNFIKYFNRFCNEV